MKKTLIVLGAALAASLPASAAFEDAQTALDNMRIGWNLGNTFDSNSGDCSNMWIEAWSNAKPSDYETAWGQPVTTRELIHMFKEAGFNAIRVPVTWYPHMGNTVALCKQTRGKWDMDAWTGYDIDPEWMARVREVVDYIIDEGMYCLLNVHHDTGSANTAWIEASMTSYNKQKERFEALWTAIANEFRDYDEHLLFGGYNEMLDKYDSWCFATFNTDPRYIKADAEDAYEAVNSYAQSFVNAVRATGGNNAERNLVVNTYGSCNGSGTWNQHLDDPLTYMKRPQDTATDHIIFDVHSYFDVVNLTNAKKDIDAVISDVETHLKSKGAPVMMSEWGITGEYDNSPANANAYAEYFTSKAKEAGIALFYWMTLSEGADRSVPKWTRTALKDAIVKGYYGEGGYNGINDIETDAAAADAPIYNLQGICVGTDAANLPAGIYIRAGKKFLKR